MNKKIFISSLLILFCLFTKAQFTNTFPAPGSSPTTLQTNAGGYAPAKLLQPPHFVDTLSANNGVTNKYAGSLIFTTSDSKNWRRSNNLSTWIEIASGSGSQGLQDVITVNPNFNQNNILNGAGYNLSIDSLGFFTVNSSGGVIYNDQTGNQFLTASTAGLNVSVVNSGNLFPAFSIDTEGIIYVSQQHYFNTTNDSVLSIDPSTGAMKMVIGGKSAYVRDSVSATAPIVFNKATGVFSIPVATSSANGYLSSTDWSTFNNKGSGTVSNVAALTLGTTGSDLSSSVVNGTTNPVITLNVPTASATNRGALSAADWSTFNSKGTGTVSTVGFTGGLISVANPTTTPAFTVAGTSGGIPYFSSTSTWASSGLLTANSLMIGGGAGTAPSTTTTGTGVLTALGVNTGSAGAFVVNGGALGTPSSGTLTNATGLPIVAGTTGTLTETRGGTNQTTYTTGDILYASASNTLSKLAIGSTGQQLTVSGGIPAWATASGSADTNLVATKNDNRNQGANYRTTTNVIWMDEPYEDIDGYGALALLHKLADRGEVNILATIGDGVENSTQPAPSTISALNTYYGRPNIPIGVQVGTDPANGVRADIYGSYIRDSFPRSNIVGATQNATVLMRKLLAALPDTTSANPTVIICGGQARNLYNLVLSPADSISSLTGLQLMKRKVTLVSMLGGAYPSSAAWSSAQYLNGLGEYDFRTDTTAANIFNTATSATWPKIVYCGFNFGYNVLSGDSIATYHNIGSPLAGAYNKFFTAYQCSTTWSGTLPSGRCSRSSWGQIQVLHAVRGLGWNGVQYFNQSNGGANSVFNAGRNAFDSSVDKNQYYLYYRTDSATIRNQVNKIMDSLPSNNTPAIIFNKDYVQSKMPLYTTELYVTQMAQGLTKNRFVTYDSSAKKFYYIPTGGYLGTLRTTDPAYNCEFPIGSSQSTAGEQSMNLTNSNTASAAGSIDYNLIAGLTIAQFVAKNQAYNTNTSLGYGSDASSADLINRGGALNFKTNGYIDSLRRMTIARYGLIATGNNATPLAWLDLRAGTTAFPTVKYNSGTITTTIVTGASEYNGNWYNSNAALNRYANGGKIYGTSTDANNSGTGETDLVTYTTKASTLSATDESLAMDIAGTFNDLTATVQLQFYFGGTNIGNTGALTVSATGGWSARVIIIRSGSTTAKAMVTVTTPGASTASYTTVTSVTGLTFTNTNIIKCTGTAGGASGGSNDITSSAAFLIWWGASNN